MLCIDRVTNWSVLRRVRPYRLNFGDGRGECIDRFYIEKFVAEHRDCICGRVAEIGGNYYSSRFGGESVEQSDVLDINEMNPRRTITIDLTQTADAPEDIFDCIICVQTLFEIYDFTSALRSLHRMLKPAGVLLVTVPGISQSVRGGMLGGAGDDWWRFTGCSARRVIAEVFSDENVVVQTYGNVLTATAFLHGLVQEELTLAELDFYDPDYEVTIGVKATKRIAE